MLDFFDPKRRPSGGDPNHWHYYAAAARQFAALMSDPGAKETMLRLAASYEEMAKEAAWRSPVDPRR